MAKMLRSGVGYQCLYEYEGTLREIMARLGLKPLSKSAEREIRHQLGFALAHWEEPYTAIKVENVVGSLKAHVERLDQISLIGTITRGAHAFLKDFCHRAEALASACRAAATTLQSTNGKGGKTSYGWYDEFKAVLVRICKQNKIEPTAGIDRITGEPIGDLIAVAAGFERLLLPTCVRPHRPRWSSGCSEVCSEVGYQ